ncbi:MAG: Rieske 2Fe-2S domain-containing protein [Gemmatimonadaceae bacterium]|nr:Rieske 2Fe-2S domain-containing protein [Gemmatimonadaceae bacterium]
MPIAQALVDALAPWKDLYGSSAAVSTSVTTVHVVALLFGGGFALAADRSTLRALRGDGEDRRRQLAELHAVHRPVLIALTLLFISGLLLAAGIDRDSEVILTRWQGLVYAFNLSCPHRHTALRWNDDAHRFQCPKHHSQYTPTRPAHDRGKAQQQNADRRLAHGQFTSKVKVYVSRSGKPQPSTIAGVKV